MIVALRTQAGPGIFVFVVVLPAAVDTPAAMISECDVFRLDPGSHETFLLPLYPPETVSVRIWP